MSLAPYELSIYFGTHLFIFSRVCASADSASNHLIKQRFLSVPSVCKCLVALQSNDRAELHQHPEVSLRHGLSTDTRKRGFHPQNTRHLELHWSSSERSRPQHQDTRQRQQTTQLQQPLNPTHPNSTQPTIFTNSRHQQQGHWQTRHTATQQERRHGQPRQRHGQQARKEHIQKTRISTHSRPIRDDQHGEHH